MDTISPVYARIVLRELECLHIATEPLFAGSGLTREQLLRGGDIALQDFQKILQLGHELSGNDRLGLMIGSHSRITALGEVGAAMSIAPTLREGLQVAESFTRLHISYLSVRALSVPGGLALRVDFHEDLGPTLRFHVESAALLIQDYIETLTGRPLQGAHFRLAIPEPEYAHVYADYIHSPVSFDAAVSMIEIPQECLDLASPYYHADMWQAAQAQLSMLIGKLADKEERPYTLHLTALLNSSEPPLPDLAMAAATLCMSERTLSRRLQQEGSNFRMLRTEALISRAAQHLLHTEKSVETIAAELGYQDAANFRRAFRKSTGCSPASYRDGTDKSSHQGGRLARPELVGSLDEHI